MDDITNGMQILKKIVELKLNLENEIKETFPDSRGRSLALTKLDECCLWLGDLTFRKIMENKNQGSDEDL